MLRTGTSPVTATGELRFQSGCVIVDTQRLLAVSLSSTLLSERVKKRKEDRFMQVLLLMWRGNFMQTVELVYRILVDTSWADKLETVKISTDDIHRHIIDEFSINCPKCGKKMQRTSEVLDCWFESVRCPMHRCIIRLIIQENLKRTTLRLYRRRSRSDAWMVLHVNSSRHLHFSVNRHSKCHCEWYHPLKRERNFQKDLNHAPPEDILNKLGADALRLFLHSPAVKAEDLMFRKKSYRDVQSRASSILECIFVFCNVCKRRWMDTAE